MMTNEQRCQLRINGVYKQIRDTHQAIRKGGHLPRNITSTTKQDLRNYLICLNRAKSDIEWRT